MRRQALGAMSVYYAITGAWPLLHMRSFEAVTGPKVDKWLVKMVGALALVNGAVLGYGATQDEIAPETVALAAGSALAFAAIDAVYVMRGRISPVYLGDAALELVLAALVAAGDAIAGADDANGESAA